MENKITQEKTADVSENDVKQNENQQQKRKLRLDKDDVPYAICPHCHKKIYNLEVVEQVYITYDVSPDERNELEYDEVDRETAWDWDYEYKCVECHETIATSEEEAEALFYEDEN